MRALIFYHEIMSIEKVNTERKIFVNPCQPEMICSSLYLTDTK